MKTNRFICLALAIMMVFTVAVPAGVFADDLLFEEEYIEENANDFWVDEYEEVFNEETLPEETEEFLVEEEQIIDDTAEVIEDIAEPEPEEIDDLEDNDASSEVQDEQPDETDIDETDIDERDIALDSLSDSEIFDAAGIVITKQPEDLSEVEVGVTYKLTVKAEGSGLTYQWQVKPTGEDWKNTGLTGNKTATLKIPMKASYDRYQYKCVITDANSNVLESNVATVYFGKAPIVITEQPSDLTNAEAGNNYYLTVKAEGEGLSYQWQIKPTGEDWKNTGASGNKTAKLKVSVKSTYDGYQYKCVITDANGNVLESKAATVTLKLNDGRFTYEVNEAGGLTVTKYLLNESSVTVPDTYNGKNVTKIGESAFENKTSLVSVKLPSTITVIGKRAFAGCTNLSEMK